MRQVHERLYANAFNRGINTVSDADLGPMLGEEGDGAATMDPYVARGCGVLHCDLSVVKYRRGLRCMRVCMRSADACVFFFNRVGSSLRVHSPQMFVWTLFNLHGVVVLCSFSSSGRGDTSRVVSCTSSKPPPAN